MSIFLTTIAFFKEQKVQLKTELKCSLKRSWGYIQDLTCDLVHIMNQLYYLCTPWNKLGVDTESTDGTSNIVEQIEHVENIVEQTNWCKVGDVTNIYMYPLLAGSGEEISKCNLTHIGMIGMDADSGLRNHMFVVYNGETNYIIHDNYLMHGINIVNMGDNVMIQSPHMYYVIILDIKNFTTKSSANIKCVTPIYNEFLTQINCIDCGPEAAKWISNCLHNGDLRLGYTTPEIVQTSFYKYVEQLDKDEQDERDIQTLSLFIPVCTLIPSIMRESINRESRNSVNSQKFQPNIVISTNSPYGMVEWEWIMIGNTILRNFRPWKRSETNFNRQITVNMLLPLLPLQCELYLSGEVQVGDEVYVKPIQKIK